MKILRVENRHNMAPFFWFVLSPCTSLSTILRGWQNIPGIYHPPSNSGKWSFIYWFPTANAIILVVTGILASWLGVDRSNLILVPWILTSWDPGHQQCHWRPPKGAVFDVCFCWSGFFPQKKHGRRHRWLEKLEKNTSDNQGYGGSGGWLSWSWVRITLTVNQGLPQPILVGFVLSKRIVKWPNLLLCPHSRLQVIKLTCQVQK